MARLAFLFFLAHPGSAATFDDTKTFLLSRYPNRDVVPTCLIRTDGASLMGRSSQRRDSALCSSSKGTMMGFVRPSHGATAPVSSSSKNSCSRGQPMQVVIGSFITELERTERKTNGGVFSKLQWSSLYPTPVNSKVKKIRESTPSTVTVGKDDGVMSAVGVNDDNKVDTNTAASTPHVMVRPPANAYTTGDALNVNGLFKLSADTVFDAMDGLLSFVESRIVTTEQAMIKVLGVTRTSGRSPATSSSSSNGEGKEVLGGAMTASASRYDLVGFMDLDPFEKSRRNFKRNPSLTKMLL